jgi:hypothetical protein
LILQIIFQKNADFFACPAGGERKPPESHDAGGLAQYAKQRNYGKKRNEKAVIWAFG